MEKYSIESPTDRGIMVATNIISFPESVSLINLAKYEPGEIIRCPHFLNKMSAGFPSPAEDYVQERLSLDERFIVHPASTFFFTVGGYSMEPLISNGDLIIVDRLINDYDRLEGKVIVAMVDNDFTVKRFYRRDGNIVLVADNETFPEKIIRKEQESNFVVWGIVQNVIKSDL